MRYAGSKRRIAKHILPIMLADRTPGRVWVEPFVGGGNMIERVGDPRIGADISLRTIAALLYIRDFADCLPKDNTEFTESDYLLATQDNRRRFAFPEFAGFAYSCGAIWANGWCRCRAKRDYVREAYNNAKKQSPRLQGVELICCPYYDLDIPPRSLIYCDPPYAGTLGYGVKFDHKTFWAWCSVMRDYGHTVYVSEYTAPGWVREIWNGRTTCSLNNTVRIERLYKL